MIPDPYTARMDEIRSRFVARLEDRLATLARLYDEYARDLAARDTLDAVNRGLHDLGGIAPTLGFVDIGTVARTLEQHCRQALKESRPLSDEERLIVEQGLAALEEQARTLIRQDP